MKNNKKNNKQKMKDSISNKYKIKISILLIFLLIVLGISQIVFSKINSDNLNTNKLNSNLISSLDKKYELNKINNSNSSPKIINLKIIADESQIIYDNKKISMYSYNSQTPGPIIRANQGDILNVTLVNNLDFELTSIHWHGILLENKMDGVVDVTQQGVNSGENYTYTFQLNQSGTYWYHPHKDTSRQVGMGLYGVIIVDPINQTQKNKIKYDKNQLLILDDIRLFNGQIPRFGNGHDASMSGRYGNNYFINGKPKFDITANKNSILKLTLVNTANARIFDFGIENTQMLVIGKDIELLEKPYLTNSLILAPGERAEVLVYLNNTNKKELEILNYASRRPELIGKINLLENSNNNINKIQKNNVNNYTNNNITKNDFNRQLYFNYLIKENLNENLPNWNSKLNQTPDIVYELYSVMGREVGGFKWTINGNYYPEKPDIQNLTLGKFYKIRYKNKQNMIHPMHMHGQRFIILSRDKMEITDKSWKDTALVFPGETLDIGLIAENEGSWVNHCHILEHAEFGMLGLINISK